MILAPVCEREQYLAERRRERKHKSSGLLQIDFLACSPCAVATGNTPSRLFRSSPGTTHTHAAESEKEPEIPVKSLGENANLLLLCVPVEVHIEESDKSNLEYLYFYYIKNVNSIHCEFLFFGIAFSCIWIELPTHKSFFTQSE